MNKSNFKASQEAFFMRNIRVGINGFGRIGRKFVRHWLSHPDFSPSIEIVLINDLSSPEILAHLFEFDSIHGRLSVDVSFGAKELRIAEKVIPLSSEPDPAKIDWFKYDVDVVLEATGRFKGIEAIKNHLKGGAPRVLLSAVSSSSDVKTVVLGANEDLVDGSELILSNASCTTNSAAPLIDVIDSNFGIESAYITTVHSYTTDQSLHDSPHRDLRRARAAALSIIPTTTGAAKAITKIFPHLNELIGGAGIRVPVPNGSLTDITFIVKQATDVDSVNRAFSAATKFTSWEGRLEYTTKPMVSVDIIGNTHSCVFDSQLTSVIGKMVKVVGWYDNESGYTARLHDLIKYWSKYWD